MAYIVNGRKVKRIGALLEPSSYGCDLAPADMQHGKQAVVNGKKITGTGKAFEFVGYGKIKVSEVFDENGNIKYGCEIFANCNTNLLFITPCVGDALIQTDVEISLIDGEIIQIGDNITTNGILYAYKTDDLVVIYNTEIEDKNSQFYYFIGKDNYL